ncbi:MAG: DUF4446 family protein [Eubacteriales bacterium]|nr:DUF4446 family protein [Eubacteriales bacterium]
MEYIIYGIIALVFILVFMLIARLVRQVRKLQKMVKNVEEKNTNVHLATQVEKNEEDIRTLIEQNYKLNKITSGTFAKHGIIRYDAFGNVGGRLSFSLAILDRYDTGFVLSSLHQDEGSYVFIKEVIRGETYQDLSDEETNALNKAKKIIVVDDLTLE